MTITAMQQTLVHKVVQLVCGYYCTMYVVTCRTADRKTMVLSHESTLSPLR